MDGRAKMIGRYPPANKWRECRTLHHDFVGVNYCYKCGTDITESPYMWNGCKHGDARKHMHMACYEEYRSIQSFISALGYEWYGKKKPDHWDWRGEMRTMINLDNT